MSGQFMQTISEEPSEINITTIPTTHQKPTLDTLINKIAIDSHVDENTAKQFIIAHCRSGRSTYGASSHFGTDKAETPGLISLYYLPFCMEKPQSEWSLDVPIGRSIIDHCLFVFDGTRTGDASRNEIVAELRLTERSCNGRLWPADPAYSDALYNSLHSNTMIRLQQTKLSLLALSNDSPRWDSNRPSNAPLPMVNKERCTDAQKWLVAKDLLPDRLMWSEGLYSSSLLGEDPREPW